MVRRYNNAPAQPSIFSRSRRHHRAAPRAGYAEPAGAYREPAVLSRGAPHQRRGGFGRTRRAEYVDEEPMMTGGVMPRQRRREGGIFGGRRRGRAGVVEERPAVVERRRTSIGDKITGALMKLQGTITRRPGLKAAGTRRMRGTDGLGSHRTYY